MVKHGVKYGFKYGWSKIVSQKCVKPNFHGVNSNSKFLNGNSYQNASKTNAMENGG